MSLGPRSAEGATPTEGARRRLAPRGAARPRDVAAEASFIASPALSGPMIRGLEIDPAVADGPQSCVLEQVTNGLAVRMALLFLLIGGGADSKDAADAAD